MNIQFLLYIVLGSLAVTADPIADTTTNCSVLRSVTDIIPKLLIGESQYPNGSLLELNFTNCGLTKLLDSNFIAVPTLITLLLNSNEIKIIDGNMFKGLRNLEKLDVSGNQIEVLTSDLLQYLPNLKGFFALNNKIHHIDSNTFNYIYYIDISNNPLIEMNLKFKHIGLLEMMNCQLKKVTLDGEIDELLMGENEINELNLPKNSNLTVIDLRRNNLTTSVIKSIDGETLNLFLLQGTKLDYEYLGEDIFKSMPHLTMLELDETNLTSVTKKLLEPLKELVYLLISGNNISEIDSEALTQLPKLETIRWPNNPWKCSSLLPILKYNTPRLSKEEIQNFITNSTICKNI